MHLKVKVDRFQCRKCYPLIYLDSIMMNIDGAVGFLFIWCNLSTWYDVSMISPLFSRNCDLGTSPKNGRKHISLIS